MPPLKIWKNHSLYAPNGCFKGSDFPTFCSCWNDNTLKHFLKNAEKIVIFRKQIYLGAVEIHVQKSSQSSNSWEKYNLCIPWDTRDTEVLKGNGLKGKVFLRAISEIFPLSFPSVVGKEGLSIGWDDSISLFWYRDEKLENPLTEGYFLLSRGLKCWNYSLAEVTVQQALESLAVASLDLIQCIKMLSFCNKNQQEGLFPSDFPSVLQLLWMLIFQEKVLPLSAPLSYTHPFNLLKRSSLIPWVICW